MGAYLSEPNLNKVSNDNDSEKVSYGASSMQGWRVTQEDAHNSISDYDKNASFFAVYDGHGGPEVAIYCSKYLPELLKSLDEYKNGDIEEALKKAFLKFDALLITDDAKKELNLLACNSEPNSDNEDSQKKNDDESGSKEKVDGEEEGDEVEQLYDEATMPLYEVLKKYSTTKKRVKKILDANRVKLGLDSKEDENSNDSKSQEKKESNEDCGSSLADAEGSSSSSKNENGSVKKEEDNEDQNGNVDFNCANLKLLKRNVMNTIKFMANKKLKENIEKEGNIDEKKNNDDGKEEKNDDDEEEEDDEAEEEEEEEEEDDDDEGEDQDYEDDDQEEEEEEDDDDDDDDEEDEDEDFEAEDDGDDDDDEDGLLQQTDGGEPGFDSGCTAVVAVVIDKKLYVANAGDSRCVVSRGGKAIEMSIDHKPEDDDEKKRIEKAGGRVTSDGRVNGGLNLSRALGDHTYKKNKDIKLENQMISPLPDIKTLNLEDNDEFMILACDGIWNSMTSQECVDYVRERINVYPKLSQIVEELFMHCLAPNCNGDGTGCDNMTCIIVTFKPYKPNILTTSNALLNQSVNSLENDNKLKDEEKLSNGTNEKNNNENKTSLKRPLENGEETNVETNDNKDEISNGNESSKKIKTQ